MQKRGRKQNESILSFVNNLWYCNSVFAMKSLKIPKGQSESVYRRRTDNTMAKRISTKGSTKHTYKANDRATRTPLKTRGELMCSGNVGSSCSTSGTDRVNLWEIRIAMIAWISNLVRDVPRITFNRYAHSQKIGKPNI